MDKASGTPREDIDSIMEELENLQNEMTASSARPELKAIEGGKRTRTVLPSQNEAVDAQEDPITTAVSALGMPVDDDSLMEFRGAGGEASLEETLGSLEESADVAGQGGLLDDAVKDIEKYDSDDDERNRENDFEKELAAIEEEISATLNEVSEETTTDITRDIQDENQNRQTLAAAVEALERSMEEVKTQNEKQDLGQDPGFSKRVGKMKSAKQEGTLQMTLSGTMKLDLQFDNGVDSVMISFNDSHLQVELSDGTEFKLPLRKKELSAA